MSDLISRQAAIDAVLRTDYRGLLLEDVEKVTDAVAEELKKLPSAEPEIIRCKDCTYWIPGYITDNDDFVPPKCGQYHQYVGHFADDYCPYGRTHE